jgi:hypothetical protein
VKTITAYKTSDCTIFESEIEARKHEFKTSALKEILALLDTAVEGDIKIKNILGTFLESHLLELASIFAATPTGGIPTFEVDKHNYLETFEYEDDFDEDDFIDLIGKIVNTIFRLGSCATIKLNKVQNRKTRTAGGGKQTDPAGRVAKCDIEIWGLES